MKLTITPTFVLLGIAFFLTLFVFFNYNFTESAKASSPPGLPATIATTSPAAVSATASTVIATSTCSARIISTTGAGGIMITFTDLQGSVPSATFGFWQPASTTVAYDSGQYGCGAIKVYSGVTQTITVSDSR